MKIDRTVEPNVFYKAEAFHIAAKVLFDNEEMKYRGAPFIVNASFSLELYLKSFMSSTYFDKPEKYYDGVTLYNRVYSKSGHSGQGHDLSNLYKQLPESIKLELISFSKEKYGNLSLPIFFEKIKQDKTRHPSIN